MAIIENLIDMSRLRTAVEHPWTAFRKVKSKILRPFINFPDEQDRTNILKEDWDNLLILDACRFDTFAQYNTIEGELSRIYSTASHTSEFVEKNIDQQYSDVVYLTASPQLVGYETNFHHVEHLWDNCWDEELRTVPPWTVTKRAQEVAHQYPNKRLIVHYMQPHYPFIGEKGDEIGEHATFTGSVEGRETVSVWDLMVSGKVDAGLVKDAYEENLEIVLPYVQELASDLKGKTVVSSDHGNLFRKKVTALPIRMEGHPMNFPDPDLIAVPWLELPYDSRKQTMEGDNSNNEVYLNTKEVKDRLEDLGYLS